MKPATFKGDAAARDCVAALREARTRIAAERSKYICDALFFTALDMYGNSSEVADAAGEVREWIQQCMGRHREYGVETWLAAHGVGRDEMPPDRMREYRLAWIDQMIRDFGGKP